MSLLRDRRSEFEEAGVRVYGISRDSSWTHIAWAQALDLDVPLLSDWNGEATYGFGVAHEFSNGMQGVSDRAAFLVDAAGVVRLARRYDSGELPDFDELVRSGRSLRESASSRARPR